MSWLVFTGVAIAWLSLPVAFAGQKALTSALHVLAAGLLLILGLMLLIRPAGQLASLSAVRRFGAYICCISVAVTIHAAVAGDWTIIVLAAGTLVPMGCALVDTYFVLHRQEQQDAAGDDFRL